MSAQHPDYLQKILTAQVYDVAIETPLDPAPNLSARTSPTLQPPTPSRYEHFAPVESYTATYYVGRADFDYTKNVPNLDGNGYDGEYGIGIHEKLGLLNNDLEKVIAIDVYLFDKTDERQPITISRSFHIQYCSWKLFHAPL